MKRPTASWALALALLIAMPAAGTAANPADSRREEKPLPTWETVERIVNETMAERAGYVPGDIIARSEVEAALARLAASGWKVADREKILGLVPADNAFIVTRLRDPAGWNFMRHVATYPSGYDRVDRLLHMPRGETMVADLITNPGGFKLFQYMTSSPGGIEMGRMLENIPSGHDFNKPTGRIYTAEKLIGRLRRSYDVEKQRRRRDSG